MNSAPMTPGAGPSMFPTSPAAAMVQGALRFAVVSVGAFSVWAFAGRWFYRNVGELGLYVATAMAFLALAAWLMPPLLAGRGRLRRFAGIFTAAFLAYAAAWCAAWFAWRDGAGEWLGSLAGSVVFAVIVCRALGRPQALWSCAAVLFATHSAGYFAGGKLYLWLGSQAAGGAGLGILAPLGWGLLYGLGFGAGMGFTFFAAQRRPG
ncbi:MAG: hypothetical protein ACKVYV_00265 [Limisphaerales bacterium]